MEKRKKKRTVHLCPQKQTSSKLEGCWQQIHPVFLHVLRAVSMTIGNQEEKHPDAGLL